MPEAPCGLAELHPGPFPRGAAEALRELNLEPHLLAFAWELSRLPEGLDESTRRDAFLLTLSLLAAQAQGHTRLALAPAEDDPARTLLARCGRAELAFTPLLQGLETTPLAGPPGSPKPLVWDGAWLYSHRMLACEISLARRIQELLARPPLESKPADPRIFQQPVELNPEQRAAVGLALAQSLALITGGPGTGKTSIVVAILRGLLGQPDPDPARIALAAPTGKAAQRLGEAIRSALAKLGDSGAAERMALAVLPEPMTLHRLLGWHPESERFRHDEVNPLPAQVVIVDESSMLSLEHMEALVRALAPGTRLVLLGDADQLPSVEAGRAYRDLIEALPQVCQRLIRSYRMRETDPEGRNILRVAGVINGAAEGDPWSGEEAIQVRDEPEALAYRKVELLGADRPRLDAFLHRWFERNVAGLPDFPERAGHVFRLHDGQWAAGDEPALEALFRHFERTRILCVLREASDLRGVQEVNRFLHDRMRRLTGEGLTQATPFLAGEPVLVTANDYRRGLFNGDQGLVLKVRFGEELRQGAVFRSSGGFKAFLLEPLKARLEHCYAMTVHKAQGSEYERVAVLLPRSGHKALTRELLYTALTRARKSVVLLGEREGIAHAMANPTLRHTGLAERLGSG